MLLDRLRPAAPCALAALCGAAWAVLASTATQAQSATPVAAPAADMTPAERAQRDADNVYRWILIHADKPRKSGPARDEKAAGVPARAKPAVRAADPVTAAGGNATVEPVPVPSAVAQAPVAAAALPVAATASPSPEVVAAAVSVSQPPAAPTVAEAERLDEPLTPVFRADPQFPPILLRTLRKGEVQVRFTVLPDGSVAEPAVVTTSNPRLNPSALAAVALWRFAPLRKAQSGVVDLGFNLD